MTARPDNPFPGLRPFLAGEEHLFFGRERQVDAMVDKLASARFLAVVGSSGSGKSSLVACGLLPALHLGLLADAGSRWRVAHLRPAGDPMGALARALAGEDVLASNYDSPIPLTEMIDTRLRLNRRGLVDAFRSARLPEEENLLVVVDQFEELFRYAGLSDDSQAEETKAAEEATAFVKLLVEAARQRTQAVYVVITMRSDFLGDCARFPGLPEAINSGQFLVARMSRAERREAIAGPIAVAGAKVDPLLLTRLVNDVGSNPDQLSILQHALRRTWQAWAADPTSERISLTHYVAIGGMEKALDQHAEEAYLSLSSHYQLLARQVFRTLTDTGTDSRGIRRPMRLAAIAEIVGTSVREVADVLAVFRHRDQAFVMPPDGVELEDDTVIDISHESLMRVWSRLRGWTMLESESARIWRRLADSADLHSRDRAALIRGPDLAGALAWRDTQAPSAAWAALYGGNFDQTMGFIDASTVEEKAEKLRRRSLRVGIVGLIVVSLVAVFVLRARNERKLKREAMTRLEAERDAATKQAELIKTQASFQAAEEARKKAEKALADLEKAQAAQEIAEKEEERARQLAEVRARAIDAATDAQQRLGSAQAEWDRLKGEWERRRRVAAKADVEAKKWASRRVPPNPLEQVQYRADVQRKRLEATQAQLRVREARKACDEAKVVLDEARVAAARASAITAALGADGIFAADVSPASDDLFDVSQGARVVSGSKPGDAADGFGGLDRMLGATGTSGGEPGSTFFEDGKPKGTVHEVVWETPAPVEVRSVRLFAAHDTLDGYAFRRAFSHFVLSIEAEGEWAPLVDYSPALPYAGDVVPREAQGGANPGEALVVCFDTPTVDAQRFRAQFTQAVDIRGKWSAPRVQELDGSSEPCPIPEQQQLPERQVTPVRLDKSKGKR